MGFHLPDPGRIIRDIEGAAHHAVEGAVHTVEGAANSAVHQIEGKVQDGLHQVEGKVKELPHLAEDALKQAAQAVVAEMARVTLTKALKVVKTFEPSTIGLTIGPASFSVPDIQNKTDLLEKWSSIPPKGREQIIQAIRDFDPGDVTLSLSAELAAVVIASDSLSIGFSVTWNIGEFVKRADEMLSEFGL